MCEMCEQVVVDSIRDLNIEVEYDRLVRENEDLRQENHDLIRELQEMQREMDYIHESTSRY